MSQPAEEAAGTRADPALTPEQRAVVEAPIDEALAVLAAAGTGKTTTMVARTRFLLSKGVPAEQLLVLTFSRKAAGEFRARLPREAGSATVSTFHAWAWQLLRGHWAEAGYSRRPAVLPPEQEAGVVRQCLVWQRLSALQAPASAWLSLPPDTPWPRIVRAAAEQHEELFRDCLRVAVQVHNDYGEGLGWAVGQRLELEQAAAAPFSDLPVRVQQMPAAGLYDDLRLAVGGRGKPAPGRRALELLVSEQYEAAACLQWLEGERLAGRLPDADAAVAGSQLAGAGLGQDADQEELQQLLPRVGAAFHRELRRQGLATLGDMPLLARRLLERGGAALAWARDRWRYVLVDEFQDCSGTMLDLLALLLGERRGVTCVGDDDQQIYSFLAAAPAIFADFRRRFDACSLCLELNFRSTAAICAFGGALLHGNRREAQKRMVPARGGACPAVRVRQFSGAAAEAEAVAGEVERLWREEGVPHSDVAVLLRCRRLRGGEPHAPLKRALKMRGIPFVESCHSALADDPGVAALAAHLAASLEVDPALEAVLAHPMHGLGHDVRGAVAQRQHAARLAGRPPPSLLACAEAVCAEAGVDVPDAEQHCDSQSDSNLGTRPQSACTELNRGDVAELGRVVALLQRLRRELGRAPLPQAVLLALRDSGLAEHLRERAAQPVGGGPEQELPPPLAAVLRRARLVAEEWDQQRRETLPQGEPPAEKGDWLADWAELEKGFEGSGGGEGQQEEGEALLLELLSQLALEPAPQAAPPAPQPPQTAASSVSSPNGGPGVLTLTTIHSAKGLEWPVVFLPRVCEGILPLRFRPPRGGPPGGGDGDEAWMEEAQRRHLEEERRLFHVAATRARDLLHVSYVQARPAHGCEPAAGADPADVPLCSSILAGALGRLRGRRDVVQLEGRLPQEDFPELCWGEEGGGSGAGGAALADATNAGSQPRQPAQLTVAEQCRLKMAARQQGGAGPAVAGGRAAKRARRPAAPLKSQA